MDQIFDEHNKDELLECLVALSQLYHNPYTKEALLAGLPISQEKGVDFFRLDKENELLFNRASLRAGFKSKLVKKKLKEIPSLVTPCVLLLKDKKACILYSIDHKKQMVTILFPDSPKVAHKRKISQLDVEYLGYAYYIKPVTEVNDRSHNLEPNRNSHWFWGTVKESKQIYFDILIASLLINIFVIASPLFTMNVYDRVVPNNAIETLWVLAIGVTVVYVIDTVLKFVRTYALEIAGKKHDIIMSSKIFEKVLDIKLSHRPKSVGSFASNLKDFDMIKNFFSSTSVAMLIDLPFAVIFLGIIYIIGGNLFLIPLTLMCAIVIYAIIIRTPLEKAIVSTFESASVKNGVLIESLSALETIKTLSSNSYAQYAWEEATGDIAKKNIKVKILSTSITTITALLVQLNTVAIVIFGVMLIMAGDLTMGGLIACVILSGRTIAPMGQVAMLLTNFEQVRTSFKNIDKIMKMPVERPQGKKFLRRPDIKGKIEFKDVSFSYPESKVEVLKNVTFTINPGEKVGILGRNGSGKTTIEKLILGLYSPTKGSILIDGIDINQIDPADLRKAIGYVPQDVVLFKGTIRDNIVKKAPDTTDEELLKAAKISCVDMYSNAHPLGFDMPMLERGDGISGGQKQSVALARACLLNPPIILLDEPTSSLDKEVEDHIIANLKEYTEEKTLLAITHKNSVLKLVDRVLVIQDGSLVLDDSKQNFFNMMTKVDNDV